MLVKKVGCKAWMKRDAHIKSEEELCHCPLRHAERTQKSCSQSWHALAVHLVEKLKIPTVHWESFSSGDQMKDRYCFWFFMGRIRGYWRSGEKRGVSRSPSVKRILLQTEHRELNTASLPAEDCAWHFTSVEKSGQSVPCFRIYRHQDRVRELQFNTKPIS